MNRERIWVIGASTGIGRAMAEQALAEGHEVVVSSRDAAKLKTIAGATVVPCDITKPDDVAKAVKAVWKGGPVDRVVVMAGTYEPMAVAAWEWEKVQQIVDVNLMGMLRVVHAVLPHLTAQTQVPQLALCASVVAYAGLPNAQPYGATKAALLNLCESMRVELEGKVDVRVINPGFVATPMTAKNTFNMPFIITPAQAAVGAWQGLRGRHFEVRFPAFFTWLMRVVGMLPYGLFFAAMRPMRAPK